MRYPKAIVLSLVLATPLVSGCPKHGDVQEQSSAPKLSLLPKQALAFEFELILSSGGNPGTTPSTLICRLAADVGSDGQAFDTLVQREKEFTPIVESSLGDHEALDKPGGYKAAMDRIRDRLNGALGTHNPVRAVYAYELTKLPKP